MASPEAMEKLRAVLDYAPEEALRRLPGDPQEFYDAVTRRLHRSVAVRSMVRRKVIVERPELGEDVEPDAPAYVPPLPPPPEPEPEPPQPSFAEPAQQAAAEEVADETSAQGVWDAPSSEATSVVQAREPEAAPGTEEFFDIVKGQGAVEMQPVESGMSLSESEWRTLEQAGVPEEEAEAPVVAGEAPPEPGPPSEDEAFEEVGLPPEGGAPEAWAPPGEQAVAEGELEPAVAEFEVEESTEAEAGDFELLEAEEAEVEEGLEPPYQVNEYTLFRRVARTKGGRTRTSYFFSAEPRVEGAEASPLPEGYEVVVNSTTGIPVIRKGMARTLPVIEIEGLGPLMAERLEDAGVRTTRDLLRIQASQVSAETGISERLLGNFVAMADLLQLPGIYPDQAAAMVYAGCRSLADLNKANPAELAKAVNQAAKDHQLKLRGKMAAARIKAWQGKINNLELVK